MIRSSNLFVPILKIFESSIRFLSCIDNRASIGLFLMGTIYYHAEYFWIEFRPKPDGSSRYVLYVTKIRA